jgi:CRISPR/Cas system CSM-associated protein Csm2 small subunit
MSVARAILAIVSGRSQAGVDITHIASGIANDLVNKANTNAARMYTYNKLCANNWYNNEFMSVARAILAVVSGRSQAGVDITHIANDVIEKYMTCYTSVQVLITPELKSTLPPNLVLASQHNASQLQQFNEEANKVFMNNNQMMPQQGMPMQQGMMMPGQQPMGMQPGMMGGQPMGMHPMQMQQPMVYNQQMMPMQAQMQPMGMPQPMGGQASFTQQGFGYQNPMAQQPEVSSKFKDVPAAYQAKEQPNVFTRAAEQVQATQVEVTSPVVSKPTVVHLTKDSPDNFVKVGDKVFSFDNVLQTKYSSDFRDKKFFKANVEMLGCLKEAVEATRHYQLENQQENYIYQAYSAPYYIIDECPTMFSCGDVVNEVLLGTVSFEEFARTLEGFYKVIDDVIEQANKENDARKLVEFYEKYKFTKGIEKTFRVSC